jgi:hypothetical protein
MAFGAHLPNIENGWRHCRQLLCDSETGRYVRANPWSFVTASAPIVGNRRCDPLTELRALVVVVNNNVLQI